MHLILFAIIIKNPIPIIWSYLIMWTYINYSYTDYHENMCIVALEYGTLLMFYLLNRKTELKLFQAKL
jgi:hypothetical protein